MSRKSAGSASASATSEARLTPFHEFVSTTVHHLREPVRMISVYTEVLKGAAEATPLSPEAAQSLEYLRKAAEQVQKLLGGLAEFSSADAALISRSPIRLELALRQAFINLAELIESTGANVSFSGLPVVIGNFDALQLLFQHLLRNSIQYCEGRKPEISISADPRDLDWVIGVHDNGPGIPLEYRERIFEPYIRLHGKSFPGNGLGLATCRSIIVQHGGSIWIESGREGVGTSFYFLLPGA